MDNKKMFIRHETGSFEDSSGNQKEIDNFLVDVNVDGENIPIKVKPGSPAFVPILRQKIVKGDNPELQCDGVESFKTGGKELNYYRFYTKVKVNGIVRKCYLKIAQGDTKIDKSGNRKINSGFERTLILEALGIDNVFDGDIVDEEEV